MRSLAVYKRENYIPKWFWDFGEANGISKGGALRVAFVNALAGGCCGTRLAMSGGGLVAW
jgi:hypothetical protein